MNLRRSAPWSGSIVAALSWTAICLTGIAAENADRAGEPLVAVDRFEKSIVVELRYATPDNVVGNPLYQPSATALVREGTARKLASAARHMEPFAYRLKVWDAYRPPSVQALLRAVDRSGEYVADANSRPALHTWGVALDVTLVDRLGRPVEMPTDFDFFGKKAWIGFAERSPAVKRNLRVLQVAMGKAGFLGLRNEWWHFVDSDWKRYAAVTPAREEMAARPWSHGDDRSAPERRANVLE